MKETLSKKKRDHDQSFNANWPKRNWRPSRKQPSTGEKRLENVLTISERFWTIQENPLI